MTGLPLDDAMTLLGRLVAHPSVSEASNLPIVAEIAARLRALGVEPVLTYDSTGTKANLFATIGPASDGGVVLCGHTDVVPVEGQDWTSDPFVLRRADGRAFGRGTCDMKGFLACVLAAAPRFAAVELARPLHIAFTFDEEIGGFGAPILVADMDRRFRPSVCIVGEPTEMQLIVGHKSGFEMRTTITGLEAHASNPRKGVSAVHAAARFIQRLEETSRALAARARPDSGFDPPYATINVGTVHGGVARNIIAGTCVFEWELRPMPDDDGDAILAQIDSFAQEVLLPEMHAVSPDAGIVSECLARVPGLAVVPGSPAIRLVRRLTGANAQSVVAFQTDAGHFQRAGISTVVCGPGSIDQAHKPDEFIEIGQMEACLAFLERLRDWLCAAGDEDL